MKCDLKKEWFSTWENFANATNRPKPAACGADHGLALSLGVGQGLPIPPHLLRQRNQSKPLDFARDQLGKECILSILLSPLLPSLPNWMSSVQLNINMKLENSSWKESDFPAGESTASSLRLMLTRWPAVCSWFLKNTGWNNQRASRTDRENWQRTGNKPWKSPACEELEAVRKTASSTGQKTFVIQQVGWCWQMDALC